MNRLIQSIQMGAYDTKQCLQGIADRQAHAVIPPRENARPWKDTKAHSRERNELLRTVKYLGRTIWKNGQVTIGAVWLKPRCIASNYWGINTVRETFKAKSMRFMHV